MRRLAPVLVILVFALTLPVVAQQAASDTSASTTTAPDATTTTAAPAPAPAPVADTTPEDAGSPASPNSHVTAVASPRANRLVHLGEEVAITISGYQSLRKAATSRQKPVTLWLDGLDSLIEPSGEFVVMKNGKVDPDSRTLKFRLRRTADNTALWRNILRDPFGERKVKLATSAGVSGNLPLLLADGVNGDVTLEKTFVTPFSILWMLLLVVLIFVAFRYGKDMLRAGPDVDGKKQAYSLARSQMAWWFVLILASYLLIWLITGDLDTITSSLLVLMGISAGTALGSAVIDSNEPAKADNTRSTLTTERAKLEATKTNLESAPTPETQQAQEAIDLRMKEIDQTVANVTKPAITSGKWLTDVLTDNNGQIALHRFQILAWTLALGLIFVASVLRDLTMPEFNTTLLGLMGISSGTYLGFKIPTNN